MRWIPLCLLCVACSGPSGAGYQPNSDLGEPAEGDADMTVSPPKEDGDVTIFNLLPYNDSSLKSYGLGGLEVMVLTTGSETPPTYSCNQPNTPIFEPFKYNPVPDRYAQMGWKHGWTLEVEGSFLQGLPYVFTAKHGTNKFDYNHGQYSLAEQTEIETARRPKRDCTIATQTQEHRYRKALIDGKKSFSAQYGLDDRTGVFRILNEEDQMLLAVFKMDDFGATQLNRNIIRGTTLAGRGESPLFGANQSVKCGARE